ncbi:MAG: hypothetical protein SPL80_10120 [Bacilli bacterium]|nr:hypothetical protein [Bacilli bacterium]
MYEEIEDGEETMVEEVGIRFQPSEFKEVAPLQAEGGPTYELILPSKRKGASDDLAAVIGHQNQKD